MKRKILSVLLSTVFIFGAITTVNAQNDSTQGNGFRVSPVREEFTIDKGKSRATEITVENVSGNPITAQAVINDFQPSDEEDGQPRILLDGEGSPTGNSFKSLVQDIPNFSLQPGEKKNIKVTMFVPETANAGGYYGAIRFAPASLNDEQQVTLSASVGVIYLVKVPGDITEKLEMLSLTGGLGERSGNFFFSSPDKTVVRLKNTGTIHLQPFGRIQVKDWRGKVISDQEFNNVDPRGNILPGSIRRFETPLNAKASFGRYKIEANLGYGSESSELITASSTFWVLPLWFLAIVGGLILLLIISILTWRRNRKRTRRYR